MLPITCIEDLRRLAQKRVPRMFYDYADTGSWSESTYRAKQADFRDLPFRPRATLDVAQRTFPATIPRAELTMPLARTPPLLPGSPSPVPNRPCPTGTTGARWPSSRPSLSP